MRSSKPLLIAHRDQRRLAPSTGGGTLASKYPASATAILDHRRVVRQRIISDFGVSGRAVSGQVR
jgi:hypothetical protein